MGTANLSPSTACISCAALTIAITLIPTLGKPGGVWAKNWSRTRPCHRMTNCGTFLGCSHRKPGSFMLRGTATCSTCMRVIKGSPSLSHLSYSSHSFRDAQRLTALQLLCWNSIDFNDSKLNTQVFLGRGTETPKNNHQPKRKKIDQKINKIKQKEKKKTHQNISTYPTWIFSNFQPQFSKLLIFPSITLKPDLNKISFFV